MNFFLLLNTKEDDILKNVKKTVDPTDFHKKKKINCVLFVVIITLADAS